MKLKYLYLLQPGTVIPVLLLGRFFGEAGTDLFLSGGAFMVFVYAEGSRRSMKHLWSNLPAGLCIGLSFALLLFLYWRGRALEAWPV